MTEGDVLQVAFPQADGARKRRPAIVLGFVPPFGDPLVCAVTSRLASLDPNLEELIGESDADYEASGLRVPSRIRAAVLTTLPSRFIMGSMGRIAPARLERLRKMLAAFFGRTPSPRDASVFTTQKQIDKPELVKSYLAERVQYVDRALDSFLPSAETKPVTLHKAMRHSIFAGGKRLRPILCLAAAEACGGSPENALPASCAVECLHTYSLIHDDLPCMDDDDMRRGVPTCHKVYGEAMALLAGDALQALAFELVARSEGTAHHTVGDRVLELARTAGSLHLVGGQVADLEGEGKKLQLDDLRFIHENKTAAMLTSSVKLGGMCANGTPEELQALHEFGMATGLAFQIIDDILDVTQTSEKLGKSAGKDVASEKSTYPALLGLDASREEAHKLTEQAHRALDVFGPRGQRLRQLADYLLARDY